MIFKRKRKKSGMYDDFIIEKLSQDENNVPQTLAGQKMINLMKKSDVCLKIYEKYKNDKKL